MNRKFRGKRVDNGDWVYGDLIRTKFETYILPYQISLPALSLPVKAFIEVDSDTIGQCTGFNDTHEKEIWANDLVRYVPNIFDEEQREQIYVVEWGRWSYVRRDIRPDGGLPWTFDAIEARSNYEVIGNLFDNPELLARSVLAVSEGGGE